MALKSLRTAPLSRAQNLSRDEAASEATLRAAFKESATHRRADPVTEDGWADVEASIDAAFAALDHLEQSEPTARRKGPPPMPVPPTRKWPPPLPEAEVCVPLPEPLPAPAVVAPMAQPRARRRRRVWPYGVAVLLLVTSGSGLWLRLTQTPLSLVVHRVQAAFQR